MVETIPKLFKMEISLESKALSLLETYEGANNYILELKRKSQINKKFYPTSESLDGFIITIFSLTF